jgi:exopolyphosphatase/pppGpp-phosphohydrolase
MMPTLISLTSKPSQLSGNVTPGNPGLKRTRLSSSSLAADGLESSDKSLAGPQPIIDKHLYAKTNDFVSSLPLKTLQTPLRLIEMGSRMVRVLIIYPGDKPAYFANYPSPLGDCLAEKGGHINDATLDKLMLTFKQLKWDLPDGTDFSGFTCVATAGLRDAQNPEAVADVLQNKLGIGHVDILSSEEEATLSYKGTLRGITKADRKKNMVIDLGSGSIQLAMGTGSKAIEKGLLFALPFGSNRIRLSDPFDPFSINMSKLYIKELLKEQLTPSVFKAAEGRTAYLNASRLFKSLEALHKQLFGINLLVDGALKRDTVNYYLTREGLTLIKKAYEEEGTLHDDMLKSIPRKLVLLSVLMEQFNLDEIQLGRGSCLRAGKCIEMAEAQLDEIVTPVAQQLHNTYQQALPRVIKDFKSIFPQFEKHYQFRVKSFESIRDKLVRYILSGRPQPVHKFEEARHAVQDGIGIRTKTLPGSREEFTKLLKRIVTEKQYTPRSYTNYESQDGLHYLTSELLSRDFTPVANPTANNPKTKRVFQKANNYTSSQITFQPPGVDDYYLEFQVRGPEMSFIEAAEHLYYDIKSLKNVGLDKPALVAITDPLQTVVNTMTGEQMNAYEAYLAECYKTARLREMTQRAYYPALPEGLSPLLEVNHLRMVVERMQDIKRDDAQRKLLPGEVSDKNSP